MLSAADLVDTELTAADWDWKLQQRGIMLKLTYKESNPEPLLKVLRKSLVDLVLVNRKRRTKEGILVSPQ